MFLLLYPFMALLSLTLALVTIVLSPILPLFTRSDGNLPSWLYWFQTFDNTLDAGWKVQGNYGTYLIDGTIPTGLTLYWYRVLWLCRNPSYGFDYFLLGMAIDTSQIRVTTFTPAVFVAWGPNGHFNVYYTGRWGELKLGWKIRAYWDDQLAQWRPDTYMWGPERRTMICFTYNPFKGS